MLGVVYLVSTLLIILYKNIFLPQEMDAKSRKKLLRFSFILMVLILGLRHPFNSDSFDVTNYYNMFLRAIEGKDFASYMDRYSMIESGYLWLNWISSKLIHWPQAILIIHAVISCYLTLKFIDRYSDDLLFTIVCFISFGGLLFYATAFRQSIAISLCLYSIKFIEEKKLIRFLLVVAIAISIHKSSIVFFPAYFLVNFNVSKFATIIDVLMVIVIGLLRSTMVRFGNDFLNTNYGQSEFSWSYIGGIINLSLAAYVILLMYVSMPDSYLGKKLRRNRKNGLVIDDDLYVDFQFFHMIVVGTGIYMLRFSTLIFERVSYFYFTPMLYILFPQVTAKFVKPGRDDLIKYFIWAILLFLIIWRGREYGYMFFWQGDEYI